MKRRCVITGMGVVSPNGIGAAAFSQAVLDGRSGVRRISRFDASAIEVQIAGEVSDFDELAWVEKKERKHVSRVGRASRLGTVMTCTSTSAMHTPA